MKKRFLIPTILVIGSSAILPLVSCYDQIEDKIDSIKIIGKNEVLMGEESTYLAKVIVFSGSPNKTVTWSITSTQNGNNSTIDPNTGKFVAGNTPGKVTIRATSVVDETRYKEFTVNVISGVKSVTIGDIDDLMWNGQYTCEASVEGQIVVDQTVTWDIVEQDAAATIDPNTGVLTAGEKTETITVRATSVRDSSISSTKTVNVVSPIKSITISGTEEQYFGDNKYTYSAEVETIEGEWSKQVKWSIAEGELQTGSSIDENSGLFKAGNKAGKVVIKAESAIDPTAFGTYEIQIKSPISKITVSDIPDLNWNGGCTCEASVEGVAGYDQAIKWSIVEKETGASIDESTGELTAGEKTETITVKATSVLDPTISGTKKVNVLSPIESITINTQTQALPTSNQIDYDATVVVDEPLSKDVTWKIAKDESTTGSSINSTTGEFTAGTTEGKVVIQATSVADPTKFATLDVYVRNDNPIESVEIKSDNAIAFGQTTSCEVSCTPIIKGIHVECEIDHCDVDAAVATWDPNNNTLTAGNTAGGDATLYVNAVGYDASFPVTIHIVNNVFKYNIVNSKAVITGLQNVEYTSVSVLPTIINNGESYPVTEIGEKAFQYNKTLKAINLKGATNLVKMGAYCFNESSITSIFVPKSVTTIERSAFELSAVKDVFIEEGSQLKFRTDGTFIFKGEHNKGILETINLENATLTTILPEALLEDTKIKTIIIPASVTKIDIWCLDYCYQLKNITFKGTTDQWKAINRAARWHLDVPTDIVHCSNGTCKLDDK